MFGEASSEVETIGKKRGEGGPKKAMQLGKAKKLPQNIDLI